MLFFRNYITWMRSNNYAPFLCYTFPFKYHVSESGTRNLLSGVSSNHLAQLRNLARFFVMQLYVLHYLGCKTKRTDQIVLMLRQICSFVVNIWHKINHLMTLLTWNQIPKILTLSLPMTTVVVFFPRLVPVYRFILPHGILSPGTLYPGVECLPRLILSSGTRYRRHGILSPGTLYPG